MSPPLLDTPNPKQPANWQLTHAILQKLMPFHIVFSQNNTVVEVSPSLQKIASAICIGDNVTKWLSLPQDILLEKNFGHHSIKTLKVDMKSPHIKAIRCEMFPLELATPTNQARHEKKEDDAYYFLNFGANPYFIANANDFGLTRQDFPHSGPSIEWLYLSKVQETLYDQSLSNIDKLHNSQKTVRQQALYDALTGLYNRHGFDDIMNNLSARRYDDQIGLLQMDLDRFKPINDTYGHEIGDKVLKTVATRIQASLRRDDLAIRLGGDEFLIIIPRHITPPQLKTIADRLIKALSEPITIDTLRLDIGASLGGGIIAFKKDQIHDHLAKADQALYEAKKNGRGNFVLTDLA